MTVKKKSEPTMVTPITGIKGFGANLQCRGFQFEVGKTYQHDGEVKACEGGFHAITGHPLAVFDYYRPAGSRFFRVTLAGKMHTDDNVKTAAEIITIEEEVGLAALVQQAVAWVTARAKLEGKAATGTLGAASATGSRGAASATGTQGAASATGTLGAAMTSGCLGQVCGAIGNALFAVERAKWNGPIVSVACGIVGQGGIKTNTWYRAAAGKLVEVTV